MDIEEETAREPGIVAPANCFLIDDTSLEDMLRPWGAPAALHPFYEKLGCQWLAKVVRRSTKPAGKTVMTEKAQQIANIIVKRLPLLPFNRRCERRPGWNVKRQVQLKQLRCFEADEMRMEISFQGTTRRITGDQASMCSLDMEKSVPVLYVRRGIAAQDQQILWYDVARELGGLLLDNPEDEAINNICTNLSSDLRLLRRQGLPIERLMGIREHVSDNQHEMKHQHDEEDSRPQHRPVLDFGESEAHERSRLATLLKGGKAYKSSDLQHDAGVTNETYNECTVWGAADMRRLQTIEGIPLFMDKSVAKNRTFCGPEGLPLESTLAHARRFAALLSALARHVFGPSIDVSCFHMYLDHDGDKLAFNKNGAVFFNLRCYIQKHAASEGGAASKGGRGKGKSSQTLASGVGRAETDWFIIACHELAHNGEAAHNREHETLMESLLMSYHGAFVRYLNTLAPEAGASSSSSPFVNDLS